ncbi:MAG: GTP 3',8-cyclase MoaA [Proteobacteria bacterium]|jgi:cyclic pyranopterin phosphate synthase|nr:GTP 3',8-cyclase MoaA [Pseudomonadota bacterium]MDA1136015.1 GTP 3',8-cyclase MoaA [Pseudomonadota bacterium]|tara:strand:+ start:911 stop:1915 length:1005 start_codon:yes stop_codon:yes gene_type:complete
MEIKNKLIDPFGREINYLRVSVTDRCDFRCTYCMSEDMQFLPKKDVLSLEEIEEICKSFMKLGTRKIRLTGGEPLVRKGIMQVINNLGKEVGKGLDELTITTNGSQLETKAEELFKAGVRRINVSLDHLDPIKFKEITRWGDLDKVKAGLKIAKEIGLKIKINTVAISEFNEYHLADILNWCGEENFDMTIIEVMPMGDIGKDKRYGQYLPLSKVRSELEKTFTLTDIPERTSGPARYVSVKETGRNLGFITPLTHNFCESCNRVRLTCTGTLYMCLGQDDNADLKTVLREKGPEALENAIRHAIGRKPKGHDFEISRQSSNVSVNRHMSLTGG